VVVIPKDFGKKKKKKLKRKINLRKKKAPISSEPSQFIVTKPHNISDEEINVMFEEIRQKFLSDISDKQAENLSSQAKWILIYQHKEMKLTKNTGNNKSAEFLIQKLTADEDIATLKEIIFSFNHESIDWITKWEELGGIKLLIKILDNNIKKTLEKGDNSDLTEMRSLLLKSLVTYTRTKTGLSGLIRTENALSTLLLNISIPDISEETILLVFKLITVPCMIPPDGHHRVMGAVEYYKEKNNEKNRFDVLLKLLENSSSIKIKSALLTFINALVNGPNDIDIRIRIRKELYHHGFKEILDKLRDLDLSDENNFEIDNQIQIFDDEEKNDAEDFKARFSHLGDVDSLRLDDMDNLFQKVLKLANDTKLTPYLIELLGEVLAINPGESNAIDKWGMLLKLARQIAFDRKVLSREESDHDFNINLETVLKQIQQYEVEPCWPLKKILKNLLKKLNF